MLQPDLSCNWMTDISNSFLTMFTYTHHNGVVALLAEHPSSTFKAYNKSIRDWTHQNQSTDFGAMHTKQGDCLNKISRWQPTLG